MAKLGETKPLAVVPAQAGTHNHQSFDHRWPCHIALLRRMGPRLRGDDSGESLLHVLLRGDDSGQVCAYCREAVRRLNVTVDTNTTAVPANRSVRMPRCGSLANVIITDVDGFCRYGLSVRKSVEPSNEVFMKPPALGATIIARIHGSLNCWPALAWASAAASPCAVADAAAG